MVDTDNKPKLFCAADTPDLDQALRIAACLEGTGSGIKLGLEFFNAQGRQGIISLQRECPDLPIFLDLKFHDIPNTVAGAVRAVCMLQPVFINIHAAGGPAMIEAARKAVDDTVAALDIAAPKLLGVTVLTSIDDEALKAVGVHPPVSAQVERLALLGQDHGLNGVVCSAHEIEILRAACGPDFTLMVPGIRPAGSDKQDQSRVTTPEDAITLGADHLVIGRPITQSPDPRQTALDILSAIESPSA